MLLKASLLSRLAIVILDGTKNWINVTDLGTVYRAVLQAGVMVKTLNH